MSIDDGLSSGTDTSDGANGSDPGLKTFGNISDALDEIGDDVDWSEQTDDDSEDAEVTDDTEGEDDGEADEIQLLDDDETDDDAEETDETDDSDDSTDDDVVVTMDDGTELPLSELKSGFLRNKDYTQKTERLATETTAMEESKAAYNAGYQQVAAMYQGLETWLQGMIPKEPDISLLYGTPEQQQQYNIEKETREQLINQVREVTQGRQTVNENHEKQVAEQLEALKKTEHAKLLDARPNLKDAKQLEAFNKSVASTAKQLGFSEEDVANSHDHRLKLMVHYAGIGMLAEKNRAAAKKRQNGQGKAKKAVRRTSHTTNRDARDAGARARRSQKAMARLKQTGSLEDALQVDFDTSG